jgi:hypothetical protein
VSLSKTIKCRVQFFWWSFQNWLRGYAFRPIQRHRCCHHTTPSHSTWCTGQGLRRPCHAAAVRSWDLRRRTGDGRALSLYCAVRAALAYGRAYGWGWQEHP